MRLLAESSASSKLAPPIARVFFRSSLGFTSGTATLQSFSWLSIRIKNHQTDTEGTNWQIRLRRQLCNSLEKETENLSCIQEDNVYKKMQESQEIHISNHLDETVAAVSITPGEKILNKLPQTALFQPPREKLHLCEEKAKSYFSSHEYKQAIQELVRCIALTRICYGDSHWKLAEAHVNLAQGYLQLKGLSLQAKQHAEKAKEILTNSTVPPYNENTDVFKCSLELFHTMGRALLSLQKFKEASENLAKAERLSKELLQCGRITEEEWMEIQAQIKMSFAQVYQGQKKSKEALPHYQEALEYIEISKGEKSLECVPILRELAGAEQALGFHDTSINHFLQVSCDMWAIKAVLDPMLFMGTSEMAVLRMPGFVVCA
ncbi:hypothetical protein MC885_011367, partial [Smutsia gigantea]